MQLFNNFLDLFIESAPWLLLGLFIAGFMQWLLPLDLLKKQLGQNKLSAIIKAALVGAPLPLCSCGVIPAAIGLRRAGASKSATVSFLVATPETGVDSISISYALLGPFMAIVRPISAILSAIYAGLMVSLVSRVWPQTADPVALEDEKLATAKTAAASCCASEKATQPMPETADKKACCNSGSRVVPEDTGGQTTDSQVSAISMSTRLVNALQFASGKLLSDITGWLLAGLALAAAIKTWVPAEFLTQWGDGFVAMVVMALVGIPMYICATASTPIAAGFLALGVSPGAVLVFMLAGPATNLSTMGMIRKEMGQGVLMAYLFSILSASISLGYLANALISQFNFTVLSAAAQHHEMGDSVIYSTAAVLLALLMLRNWIGKYLPGPFKHYPA